MPDEKDGQEPTGDANGQPPPPPPIEPTVEQRLVALESKSYAYDKKYNGGDLAAAVRLGEGWLIAINAGLLIANIVIACIYYGQLKQMRIATGLTREAVTVASNTLTETQASNTRQAILTDKARESSESTAAKSLQATIDTFHREQRPWVSINVLRPDSPEAAQFRSPLSYGISGKFSDSVVVVIRNTGRTPALMLKLLCCKDKEAENIEAAPNFDDLENKERLDLIAHNRERQQMIIKDNPAAAAQIASMLPKEMEDLIRLQRYGNTSEWVIPPNGTKSFTLTIGSNSMKYKYAVGKLLYRDDFDRTHDHVTKFCLVKYSQLPLGLCDTGQDMN